MSVVSGDDFTGHEVINGLPANTTIYVSPVVDGVRSLSSGFYSFRTPPQQGVDATVTFCYGSCLNAANGAIWASIAAKNPNALFIYGDFGYPVLGQNSLANLRAVVSALYTSNYQSQIVNRMLVVQEMDDHDAGCTTGTDGNGDLSSIPDAWTTFNNYRPSFELVNPAGGLWQEGWFANVKFWILDVRSQREGWLTTPNTFERFPTANNTVKIAGSGSANNRLFLKLTDLPSGIDDAYKTWYAKITTTSGIYWPRILGYTAATGECILDANIPNLSSISTYALKRASMLDMNGIPNGQVSWLINGINSSPARWNVIISPVGWNPTSGSLQPDGWGGWDIEGFEQNHLRQRITNTTGLMVWSGDYHGAGIDDGTNSGYPEHTVSPFDQSNDPCRGTYTNGKKSTGKMFGYATFTATRCTMTNYNSDGVQTSEIMPLVIDIPGPPPDTSPHVYWMRTDT